MQTQYTYYPQSPTMRPQQTAIPIQQQQPLFLKGRPVASLEEVRALPIDFDGTVFFFPDLAHERIYTKQIGLDGSPLFNMYVLQQIPSETPADYVTREEFEKAIDTEHEHLRTQARDKREGASPLSRKHYLEVKSMNADKVTQVKELEKYMNELTSDIVEMIQDASPEEKQLLHKKMQMLTSKIEQI